MKTSKKTTKPIITKKSISKNTKNADILIALKKVQSTQLRMYEKRFHLLVERSKDYAVFMIDPSGHVQSWNQGAGKIKGYREHEIIGKHISVFYTKDAVKRKEPERSLRVAKEKGSFETKGWRVRKDGTKFWADVLYTALYDNKGSLRGYSKITHDLTGHKFIGGRVKKTHGQSPHKFGELSGVNKELLFLSKKKGKQTSELITANHELLFKELLFQNKEKGKRAAELIIANKELLFQNKEKGKRALELVVANKDLLFFSKEKGKRAAELIIANKELLFQNKEKGKRAAELVIANRELLFQNKEKNKRAAELIVANKELLFQNKEKGKRAAELIIANKELLFQNKEKGKRAAELVVANEKLINAENKILKFNQELERKVIERTAQLEAVNKELEAFSYSISHDLRAPLRAINGYAKILQEDYADKIDADGTRSINSIMHSSVKMGILIDDLLAFSRLGRKNIAVSDIKMASLVQTIKEEQLQADGVHKPEFKIDALPPAKGDQSLIKQVWINLISNAIKYSSKQAKPLVEIGATEKDNKVIYYIKDNGAGFDMQYYHKLFGVFQRLHTEEEFEGTGIGLAIIQKIVHKHNGTVWAESKLNEGTCFYFSLPGINS